jgi:hypothetical protein
MREKVTLGKWLWSISCCVFLMGQLAFTQDTGRIDPKLTTSIALASSSGTPGTSVVLPIYFTPADGVLVSQLKLTVTFVSANLKFDRVERGIAAEMGGVELKSELNTTKNDKNVETSTLEIHAQSPDKTAIPPGLLGYITLRINETGRPANISMRVNAEGLDLSEKRLTNIRTSDAQVEVLAVGTQPAVACFFFSH